MSASKQKRRMDFRVEIRMSRIDYPTAPHRHIVACFLGPIPIPARTQEARKQALIGLYSEHSRDIQPSFPSVAYRRAVLVVHRGCSIDPKAPIAAIGVSHAYSAIHRSDSIRRHVIYIV